MRHLGIALLALLTACGPTVVASTPETVTVERDQLLQSAAATYDQAAAACAQYGKRPQVHSEERKGTMGRAYVTYDCVP